MIVAFHSTQITIGIKNKQINEVGGEGKISKLFYLETAHEITF